jgi:putative nucleotidyltransferase with HDIG domain
MTDRPKIKSITTGKPAKGVEKEAPVTRKGSDVLDKWFLPKRARWLILVALSLIISVFLFPNILSKPKSYRLGDVAERDIKASYDFLIENKELTEENREAAVKQVLAVYDFDSTASNLASRMEEAFKEGRKHISKPSQTENPEQKAPRSGEKMPLDNSEEQNPIKNRFFAVLEILPDDKVFEQLMKFNFLPKVEKTVIQLLTPVFQLGVVGNMTMLMNQIDKGGIILHEIHTKKEIKVTDFNRFYDLKKARRFIESQRKRLNETMNPPELAQVSIKLAKSLIEPNLTFNQRETGLRKDLAQKSVKPFYFKIKKGEMLIREGERIGRDHLLKLSGETKTKNRMYGIGRVPAMGILIGILFWVMYLVGLKRTKSFRDDGRDLLFNSSILLGMFIFIWANNFVAEEVARGFHYFTSRALLFAMPVACGAMLISIFQGIEIAVAFSLVISVLASIIIGGRVEFFIYFFVSSIVAAYGVRNCNERVILIKTGLKLGLIQLFLSLSILMIHGSLYTMESVVASASGFIGGILTGIIATGILPLVEMSFGYTTDIKLLELASLDQPLLRDLMVQAPGTHHHSVIISNMVEATAKAVQANPLLAKVSAYYHDIGKMKKPLYFIENQMDVGNRHEKLAPSMSSLILISHVKDGVELAKKQGLGKEIIDIIQQHHGSSLISYFYQKAKEKELTETKGGKSTGAKEENFRYPGPKPQTKEAGLVMLADVVEAASRSLQDPTPSRIQGMVQKIMNKVFSDGQLDECELTLKDLHEIAKSFNKTLSGIFHQRVEYPETAGKTAKKVENASTDPREAEDSGTKKSEDKAKAGEGLKRLGL